MKQGIYKHGIYISTDGIKHKNICDNCYYSNHILGKPEESCPEPWDNDTKSIVECPLFRKDELIKRKTNGTYH